MSTDGNSPPRIPQLDGVRGIAILLVLVWHYFTLQIVIESKGLGFAARQATMLAWSGVDLFFVLSGFLIAGILLDQRGAANFFRMFYLRRACRIFPLYFLMLALLACLYAAGVESSRAFRWLFENPMPFWSYASFTQNLVMGERGTFGAHWLGVSWSLAIEEQFYLVMPFLIYFLPRRALVCVLVIAILAAPLLRHLAPGFQAFVNAPWRSDSLLTGALLAMLVRWQPFAAILPRQRNFLRVLLLGLLLGAAVLTLHPLALGVFNLTWLAALYAVLILIAFAGVDPVLGRALALPVLCWLGRLSFGIYLLHQPVSGLMHGSFGHAVPQMRNLQDAGITLGALGVTFALAALSYRYLELPVMRLGYKSRYLPGAPG